ncbi:MAG: hypothetical protein B6D35_01025 [Candidatus Brocadia sp. UTAMX2]|jgi:phytoene dehydrogenase-like protein|nr:MAG: hypothetical protein B6D35_01025 [Candidatus Brocadia sp. UTAMX2]
MPDYDVVVIGSGIGGLISAGILVSRGLKILLVEKNVNPGGYLSSFKRGDFIFDSAVDCFSGVENGGLISNVLKLLGIDSQVHFVRVDPIRVSMFPNLKVSVDSDINTYMDKLMAIFPSEAAAIRGFFKRASMVYDELQIAINKLVSGEFELNIINPNILKLMYSSYEELLVEYITDYRLKAVLSDRCTFVGLPPSKASAFSMIALMMSYFKFGAYRPVGGFQKLANVFIDGIRKNGGKAIFGTEVKQIILDKENYCTGVKCDNDDEYTTRYIISNADFNHTFRSIMGGKYSSFARDMTENIGSSTSFFIVYAGIRGDAGKHSSIGYYPSYDMEGFFSPDKAFKEDTTIGITIASIEDKSRVPEGCNTIVLHEMADGSRWDCIDKSRCTGAVLKKAENIIPGITDRIVVLDSATPQTLQRYTGNYHGAAFGWRQAPVFKGIKRCGINNLYIAGHWGNMGGGVLAAAYAGVEAAGEILAKEGIHIAF